MLKGFAELTLEVALWMIDSLFIAAKNIIAPYINSANVASFVVAFIFIAITTLVIRWMFPCITTKKWRRVAVLLLCVLFLYGLCKAVFGGGASIIVALIVALIASIHDLIQKWFFPPILDYDFVESMTYGNHTPDIQQKWIHLLVFNRGFTSAKNVRVRIRDSIRGAWACLHRPFADHLKCIPGEKIMELATLSGGDSDQFDFGVVYQNRNEQEQTFQLTPEITPNGQQFFIPINTRHTYYVSIIADNAPPVHRVIEITNPGFRLLKAEHFKTV